MRFVNRAFSLLLPMGALLPCLAFGDIITGKVTDLATKAPLSGVKVAGPKSQTLTAADGSYSLNTEAVTAIPAAQRLPEIAWDAAAGAFRWDRGHGTVRIEVRDIRGNFLDRYDSRAAADAGSYAFKSWATGVMIVTVNSAIGGYRFRMNRVGGLAMLMRAELEPGRAAIQALVKTAATTKIGFTMAGYDIFSQYVDGSRPTLDAALNKTGGLAWKKARMTWYTSYPDPGSEECVKYNGCQWAGQFAAIGTKSEAWVAEHNLVAVHSRDFPTYKLKTLRLKYKEFMIDAQVVDMCSDTDCNGCCTQNANTGGGFLIDLESYGTKRFGLQDGTIDWACIDC